MPSPVALAGTPHGWTRLAAGRQECPARRAAGLASLGPRPSSPSGRTPARLAAARPGLIVAASGGDDAEVVYLYDGECPLRGPEVDMLRMLDRGQGRIGFVDIASPSYDPGAHQGVTYEDAMGPPHAILKDGTVVTSVEVYRQLYSAVGLGFVWAATKLPGVKPVVDGVFDIWTAQRLRLTGRGSLEDVLAARGGAAGGEKTLEEAEEFLGSPVGRAVSRLSVFVAEADLLNALKRGIARRVAGDYDADAVNADLDATLSDPGVVVFSWSTCPFCLKAKGILEESGAEFTVRELDLEDGGSAVRCELAERTGRTSMPSVWIGGEFVGGCNDGPLGGVAGLERSGELAGRLEACGAMGRAAAAGTPPS